jgi:hypothetical protein
MAAESKLQSRIHRHLKRKKWLVNKTILCSVNGWPDTTAIKKRRIVFLEIKATGRTAEPLQEYIHGLIRSHGFEVYVIDKWEDFIALNL